MSLPITALRAELSRVLRGQNRVILQAPTGSGKSTQVSQLLLRHGFLDGGQVVVLQPRRLAARLLARRVAEEVGAPLGDVVGYQIRLESKVSAWWARGGLSFCSRGGWRRGSWRGGWLRNAGRRWAARWGSNTGWKMFRAARRGFFM
jgi:hypothetical protein